MNTGFEIDNLLAPAKRDVKNKKEAESSDSMQNFLDSRKELIEIDGRKQFFKLQLFWTLAIFGWISSIIMFHIVLTWMIGLNKWYFQQSPNFLSGILIENFLQITVMGLVIVKFFHPKASS